MNMNCMGRVSVGTPGTVVPLTTDPKIVANRLLVQPIREQTGFTYLGTPAMDKDIYDGVAYIVSPNSSGFWIATQDAADTIRLADYAIDADVAGEGLVVTYWTE